MTEQVDVTDNNESAASDIDDYDAEWAKEDKDTSSLPSDIKVVVDAPPNIVDD